VELRAELPDALSSRRRPRHRVVVDDVRREQLIERLAAASRLELLDEAANDGLVPVLQRRLGRHGRHGHVCLVGC
jgi:hypothetical protein